MSLLGKTQAQLKSCQFQFKKLFDNNKVLCEIVNLATHELHVHGQQCSTWDCVICAAAQRIKELKEQLK